jgi:hypothetical protein
MTGLEFALCVLIAYGLGLITGKMTKAEKLVKMLAKKQA